MGLAAGAAAGADQHRNALRHRRPHHQPQIAADRHRRTEGFARAEVMRPRIDAAAIDPDRVEPALHPGGERGFGKPVAENTARRQQSKFLHAGILRRCAVQKFTTETRRKPSRLCGYY
jgi:hypothetical protein